MKYNVLLLGPIGSGKTFSTYTLVEAGLELFFLSTEPGIYTTLREWEKRGYDTSRVHVRYIPPAKTDWATLQKNAEFTNRYGPEQLQKLPSANKQDYMQFIDVVSSLANYIDERTGEEFGAVDDWDDSRALVVDGLSGLSRMARQLVVGAKPILTQPEWGVAMGNIQTLNEKLTGDTKCTFVMISHVEREKDEVSGGTHLTVSTLGNKLAPQLVKPYDEVVLAVRRGGDFFWSTTEGNVDLKSRSLGFSSEIKPDFKQLFEQIDEHKAA